MISFGPVPSRRLGKSLGINNIVSPKVCSYNCVYCQVGITAGRSTERQFFFSPQTIFTNVREHLESLKSEEYPDYLTFVSNGEPTLDMNLGESIRMVRKFNIPVAVITNASMLTDQSVKDDLNNADWISVKMDAGNEKLWHAINRPLRELDYERLIESILQFTSEYEGTLCTETMVVKDLNDTEENASMLSETISRIRPDTAYLAVPVRPPSSRSVKPPEPEILNNMWQIFNSHNIKTELLTGFEGVVTDYTGNIYEDILNITAVHPLREDSLLTLLKNSKADYLVVKSLIQQRLLRLVTYNGEKFYLREYHLKN